MSNVNELRKSSAFCEDGMKPKITLHRTFHDVGWTYHVWKCSNETAFGFGASPKAAYLDWVAEGEKV